MAYLIASIADEHPVAMIASAQAALRGGADRVELRLDALVDPVRSAGDIVGQLPANRWIATYRSVAEGGAGGLPADVVGMMLTGLARSGGMIDVELGRLDAPALGDTAPGQVIVSQHDFSGRPADLASPLIAANKVGVDAVAKLAWRADGVSDTIAACGLMRSLADRRIVIPMGEKGLPARVLAAKFGGWGSFCAPDGATGTAPGQVSLTDMLSQYGWKRIGRTTRVLGVIGCPVAHSMSPAVFNAQFAASGWDGVYLPWRIDSEKELFGFLDECQEQNWFDAHGFSVTLPHKAAALRLARQADPLAERIGAANTLMLGPGGWTAYNTDYVGAVTAIKLGLGISDTEFAKLRVAVLGAGGVARAVVGGLCDHGATVTVYNRSAERAGDLAGAFGCRIGRWNERGQLDCDLAVNCTSVGMHPEVDASPLAGEVLQHCPAVFDTVYNPMQTKLLREAEAAGCVTIDGVAMFVQQAAAQYRIWTRQDPDTGLMEQVVRTALDGTAAG